MNEELIISESVSDFFTLFNKLDDTKKRNILNVILLEESIRTFTESEENFIKTFGKFNFYLNKNIYLIINKIKDSIDLRYYIEFDNDYNEITKILATFAHDFDVITIQNLNNFYSISDWGFFMLHELAHATGHKTRLNRPLHNGNDKLYAMEELRAEFASQLLADHFKINCKSREIRQDIIEHWFNIIGNDKSVILLLKNESRLICDYIINSVG